MSDMTDLPGGILHRRDEQHRDRWSLYGAESGAVYRALRGRTP